jgi:hypothetical protein
MADYNCPLCGRKMARDLARFLDHTNTHVIDKIKESHPDWVTSDGACAPCEVYYRQQLSGQVTDGNIGPRGRQARLILGLVMLMLSIGLGTFSVHAGLMQPWRLLVGIPLFLSILCLMEYRDKTCIVYSEAGIKNMDSGSQKIDEQAVADAIRARGRGLVVKSLVSAAALTILFFIYP